jgi:hypothetical protein
MADRIIVMDAGWVKAAGVHAELAARNPLLAELAATHLLASTETRWPDPGTGRQRRSWPGRRRTTARAAARTIGGVQRYGRRAPQPGVQG